MQIIAILAFTDSVLTEVSEFKSVLERMGYNVHLEQLGYNLNSQQIGYFEEDSVLLLLGRCHDDPIRCREIATYFILAEADVIIAMQAPAVKAALDTSTGTTIPIVFTHIADPFDEGILDANDKNRFRLTGVCDGSLESSVERLKLIPQLVPAPAMVHIFTDPSNPVSMAETKELNETAIQIGVELIVHAVSNQSDTRKALAAIETRVDHAILRTSQPWLANLSGLMGTTAYENYIPYIGINIDEMERCGSLFGLDQRGISSQAAEIVNQILNGKTPDTIPFCSPEKQLLGVNLQAARDLGLVISPVLIEKAQIIIPQSERTSLGGRLLIVVLFASLILGLIGASAALNLTIPWLFATVIATALVAFILWLYLQQHIIKPIQKLTRVAQQIGAGNLEVEIGESHIEDEIGVLGRAFRRMRNNLKHFQAEIQTLTASLQLQIQERTEAFNSLQITQQQLEIASRRIIDADNSSRFSLTTYIHDEVLGLLDELVVQAHQDGNQTLQDLTEQIDWRIRRVRFNLSVPVIQDMDIELRRLLHETLPQYYPEHQNVKLILDLSGLKSIAGIEQACTVLLYRFVLGAVSNVYRHASAKRVEVEAVQLDDKLIVRVCDDGVGFNTYQIEGFITKGHFFFHDIAVRARQLDGDLQINSADQGGTCLEISLPLNRVVLPEAE